MNTLTVQQLEDKVRQVFQEVTRYPLEILDLNANLEEDLGIDSVKLGEVFSVLRAKFGLPEKMGIQPEQLLSIHTITLALHQFMMQSQHSKEVQTQVEKNNGILQQNGNGRDSQKVVKDLAAVQFENPIPISKNGNIDLMDTITNIFAEVTRYPKEILIPDANLEEDLGIDSVKLGEVFSVIRQKYHLPEKMNIQPEQLRNIHTICMAIEAFVGSDKDKHLHQTGHGSENVHSENGATNGYAKSTQAMPLSNPNNSAKDVHAENGATNGYAKPKEVYSSNKDLDAQILQIFADVTRYPSDILTTDAHLEDDLGIDSVKLGEVFSVLRQKFNLPEKIGIPPEKLTSIGGITSEIQKFLQTRTDSIVPSNGHSTQGKENLHSNGSNGIGKLIENGKDTSIINGRKIVKEETKTRASFERFLEGKTVFISGSGRGLGKAIALHLADLGAHVIINSFHSKKDGDETTELIKNNGGKVHHIWGSVANTTQIDRIFDEIETTFGSIDFFIGNASNGMLAPLEDITSEHWEKAFRTNVVGLHHCSLRALKLMKKNGGGKIITMSSPASQGYVDYFGCMGAVKAAVESLTRSMAIEFAKYNVQVNCVSPGPVYGDLLNKWPESHKLIPQWEHNTAYPRLCEADDVAHFIAYLLKEEVKLFTGSVLVMDGGISSQGW